MSRERALRRADRERALEAAATDRRRRDEAARQREKHRGAWRARLPRTALRARQPGLLAQRRRSENAVVALVFAAVQVLTWLLSGNWYLRLGVLLVSALAVPVLVTLALDRRS